MTQPAKTYTIVSRIPMTKWVEDLQQAVSGWQIKARWNSTRAILPVFVPDDVYTPENVDKLIRAAGAVDEQVHRLGA